MNLEIIGKLLVKYPTLEVSNTFKKREFVLDITEERNGTAYPNYAKMQLVQNKCEFIDKFNVGDVLKISFNIKGNSYEKDGATKYLSNLDAWRIEYANAQPSNNNPQPMQQNRPNNAGTPNQGYSGGGQTNYSAPATNLNASPDNNDDLPF